MILFEITIGDNYILQAKSADSESNPPQSYLCRIRHRGLPQPGIEILDNDWARLSALVLLLKAPGPADMRDRLLGCPAIGFVFSA